MEGAHNLPRSSSSSVSTMSTASDMRPDVEISCEFSANLASRSNALDPDMIYEDEAEGAVLSSVEQRAKDTQVGEDGFRPAVRGERPLLRMQSLGVLNNSFRSRRPSTNSLVSNQNSVQSQRSNRHSVAILQDYMQGRGSSIGMQNSFRSRGSSRRSSEPVVKALRNSLIGKSANGVFQGRNQKARTLLRDLGKHKSYYSFKAETLRDGDPFRFEVSRRHGNGKFDDNASTISFPESSSDESIPNSEDYEGYPDEGLPLLNNDKDLSERKWRARKLLKKNEWKAWKEFLNPVTVLQHLYDWFIRSTLLIAIPFFAISFVLFYFFGNPSTPNYIPGDVCFSWWFDFAGRQLVMLELSRFSQAILVDGLIRRKKGFSKLMGPWVTVYFHQSRGWPFVLSAWGFWDLMFLEGNSRFKQHWFYFTGLQIFSKQNSGAYILSSHYYLRILFCMIIAGIARSLKETVLTLYFGRRMVATYKRKLQDIVDDVLIISEVADLSMVSDNIADIVGIDLGNSNAPESRDNSRKRREFSVIRWSDIQFDEEDLSDEDSLTNEMASQGETPSQDGRSKKIETEFDNQGKPTRTLQGQKFYGSSTRFAMKSLLDKWEEPINKGLKSQDLFIADILRFSDALHYMDLDYPFNESFGLASTRNEMISSAELVYKRLKMLSPDSVVLNFSAFEFLLIREDGSEDEIKKKKLVNTFHPDPDGAIDLLSFVQACDTVYRKLRFFRASVGNSSVIDSVLKSIINPVFYFLLVTILLMILEFNPMSMLVPFSSLLLAGSFAFGSTCAKAFEGIMLIVGRRPYAIGDRIVIQNSAGADAPEMTMSWIVEDISVLSTTLRFGATNEIAQVSNSSIASARITNCNRSEKATVSILLHFHLSCHKDSKTMEKFREGVEQYVRDNRNTWDALFFFRCENVDANREEVVYRLSVRSIHPWQVSNRVYRDRGELHQFCNALSYKLDINYEVPNQRSIMYYGGHLENGGVQDYRLKVLKNSNIKNNGDCNFLTPAKTTVHSNA